MLQKKQVIVLVVFLAVAVAAWTVWANPLVDQKVVLSGKVMAGGMAAPGTAVREGDILLVVDTITGPVPAARATTDGIVRQVLVEPGDAVRSGDVVVRIEARK
ncbi:MAG: hypothetical protein GX348_05980 [Veillonellaceae bacterium]|jgi:acetyl/propionyl-CoA carboxylase alpha subunit|nr:hypothetical protein [Veillonellaceae bacterium]